jgi:hypothetical protein
MSYFIFQPMLETVKMHPMLVTATKESELSPSRWRNKEYHEIIAECAQVSLDVLESGLAEEINPTPLRPRLQTNVSLDCSGGNGAPCPSTGSWLLFAQSTVPVYIFKVNKI